MDGGLLLSCQLVKEESNGYAQDQSI
jgi:hypothetical protein